MTLQADEGELQQLLNDTTRTEKLLLQRASQHSDEVPAVARTQAATQLISQLRDRAKLRALMQKPDTDVGVVAYHEEPEAAAAVEAIKATLESICSKQVITELCSILHKLYFRQAQLQAQSSHCIASNAQQQQPVNQASGPDNMPETLSLKWKDQPANLHAAQSDPALPQCKLAAESFSALRMHSEADSELEHEVSDLRYIQLL